MKKIGIVTFHRAKNYGAVLQAFALEQTLLGLGSDCEIIDYKCENIDNCYKPFQFDKGDPIKSFLKSLLMFGKRRRRIKSFSSFYDGRLKKSAKTLTAAEMPLLRDKYDLFITGSDQVWGPGSKQHEPDGIYFLDFARAEQKYSYAASFGRSSVTDDRLPVLRRLLEGFQGYSVREQSAVDIIKAVNGKKAQRHIDPTFLLTREEWLSVSKKPKAGDYILLFNVKPPKSLISFAQRLSREKNLPVIYLTDNPQRARKGFSYVASPTVEEFIGYFANAKYTVTNSFHGTAFSVIFNRSLFVEYETQKGVNERAESLLNMLGIRREIKDGSSSETDIDWKSVNEVLFGERKRAVEYLKTLV